MFGRFHASPLGPLGSRPNLYYGNNIARHGIYPNFHCAVYKCVPTAGQADFAAADVSLLLRKLLFEGFLSVGRRGPRPIVHLIAKPGELAFRIAAGVHDRAGGRLV